MYSQHYTKINIRFQKPTGKFWGHTPRGPF